MHSFATVSKNRNTDTLTTEDPAGLWDPRDPGPAPPRALTPTSLRLEGRPAVRTALWERSPAAAGGPAPHGMTGVAGQHSCSVRECGNHLAVHTFNPGHHHGNNSLDEGWTLLHLQMTYVNPGHWHEASRTNSPNKILAAVPPHYLNTCQPSQPLLAASVSPFATPPLGLPRARQDAHGPRWRDSNLTPRAPYSETGETEGRDEEARSMERGLTLLLSLFLLGCLPRCPGQVLEVDPPQPEVVVQVGGSRQLTCRLACPGRAASVQWRGLDTSLGAVRSGPGVSVLSVRNASLAATGTHVCVGSCGTRTWQHAVHLLVFAFPDQLSVSPAALVTGRDQELACTAHNVTPADPSLLFFSLLLGEQELEGAQAAGWDVEAQGEEDPLFHVTERWLLPPLGTPAPPHLHCRATMQLPGLELSWQRAVPVLHSLPASEDPTSTTLELPKSTSPEPPTSTSASLRPPSTSPEPPTSTSASLRLPSTSLEPLTSISLRPLSTSPEPPTSIYLGPPLTSPEPPTFPSLRPLTSTTSEPPTHRPCRPEIL
ncbi:mucosal addressin cell adhesion molecule 1, partial [Echinops telfairi]|uniref:Mucosal addressin cell adhesion molecule 1 n=1 Tax=Echinops telfairi TaxID=9371 RepID=A0ABM0J886_ECHTE